MTAKVIIFDFDGTIADTLLAIVNITNRLALEFGYKQTTPEELAILRNLKSREIINRSGVSIFKLPFLVRKVQTDLRDEIYKVKPFPKLKETLEELRNQGNHLGIITSNSQENVTAFLRINELQDLFDFVDSGTRIFGKSKAIERVLRQENLKAEDVVYVGDETRDIEAAKRSQIKVIAVSWGFNSREVLAAQTPNFLIDHPSELVEVIRSLQQRRPF